MLFRSRSVLLTGAALALMLTSAARAEIPNNTLKLGVLTDLSGFAADSTGPGSVVAAKLAVEDFKAEKPDLKVEVIQADHQNKADIGGALAEFLRGSKGPTPSVEEAARHLGLSKRTLNRRLAEQNLNFSLILDQSRRQRAEKLLLMHEGMSIEAIGELLGYAETASFTRAFKRWNGTAPLRFRRQRLADFDAAH